MNKNKVINDYGGENIENIVINTHNINNLEEYKEIYSLNDNDDSYIIEKKKNNDIWGGLPEQISFASIFNINLIIYDIVKLDSRNFNIISCTLKSKEHRLKEIMKYNNRNNIICSLIYENMSNPHYSLIIKN